METKQVKIIPLAKKKIAQPGEDESMVLETIYKPGQIVKGHGGRYVAQRQYQIYNTTYLRQKIFGSSTFDVEFDFLI